MRLPGILGRPLIEFDDEEALDIVRDVNGLLAAEVYRELNEDGAPGGIIQFPDDMTVIIMGDIHAQADNILRVITEGGTLAALERGEASLVFLGDLVHSQETGELESMESSVFILDLFFMLKRRFPKNVFYIRGNHESFSPRVGKGSVPQGIYFRKHLEERRGKEFVAEIETLFDRLAFVVQGNRFAACHGAPVRSKANRDTLVNIQRYPGLQYELVWSRLRNAGRPSGYTKGSVKRFRKTLNLPKHAPLIVAHTPLSLEDTLWLDVGNIKGHHVVYSAHTHRIAAMVMRDGRATPLEFIPEPVLASVSDGPDKMRRPAGHVGNPM
jgi:predicted phosphodiesterase